MALSQLPLASGQRHKEVFLTLGWVVRADSNHIVLTHSNFPEVFLSIPNHNEVKKGTLKSIIRDAGLSDEEYGLFFQRRGRSNVGSDVPAIERFRETVEPTGGKRIHCETCCQEVCFGHIEEELSVAKQAHRSSCTGPI
jgi:predicted RNA binding protein YcfA (HicA-like mRNA interferase family)